MKYAKTKVQYGDGLIVYLFAIVANLAVQFVLSAVAMGGGALTGGGNLLENDYFQLVCMLLLQAAFLAVPCVFYGLKKKSVPLFSSPLCKPHASIALSVLLPVLSICGFYLPAAYFGVFLEKIGYPLSAGVSLDTAGKFVLGVFVMVLAAPFVEEVIFRGFLLNSLRQKFNPYVASLLCAVAFSLMHMNPEQTVYQFCLGYVCSLAVIKSNNLLAGVVTHAGSNLIAVLLDVGPITRVAERVLDALTATSVSAVLSTLLLLTVCGAAIYFVCYAMEKLRAKKGTAEEKTQEEKEAAFAERAPQTETVVVPDAVFPELTQTGQVSPSPCPRRLRANRRLY